MKIQTVYPAAIMKIACPNCKTEGTVKKERPPEKDFSVFCPRCKETFLVKINVRKFYRKEVCIPVRYSIFDADRPVQKMKEGTIIDISREGLCIESHARLYAPALRQEGNIFQLFFSLPPKQTLLKVQGEVMRIIRKEGDNSFKIGIKFCNLDEFSAKNLGFFLWP